MQRQLESRPRSFFRSRAGLALLVFLGVGALFLVYEHRMHVLGSGIVPIALLGLCALMHFFMHGGHGGHGGHDGHGKGGKPDRKDVTDEPR